MKIYFLFLSWSIVHASINFSKIGSIETFSPQIFQKKMSSHLYNNDELKAEIEIENRKYQVNNTINEQLEKYIRKELRRYRSDYTSVVIIDNNNAQVIASVDYTRETKKFGRKLGFSSTNPAASVFKLITAASLIENSGVKGKTAFNYNGRSTTLYKYQLKPKKTRWTRKTNLNRAFAISNNVVFGKAARNYSDIETLEKTALSFGFDSKITQSINIEQSHLFKAKDNYNLAELASGFNKQTQISPLHGAVFASIVANEGILKKPSITSSVVDVISKKKVWRPSVEVSRVISKETSSELSQMMELTVNKGTARGAFRKMRRSLKKNLIIGGKTGTITGGIPYGRRDWFVSYAKPKNKEDAGISIAVMIVNVKKWYIKSPYLAKNIIQYYYKTQKKLGK